MSREVRRLRRQRDVDGLIRVATDKHRANRERRSAVDILGDMRERRAVDALISLLKQPGVMAVTSEALAKIGDGRAAPHLMYLTKSQNRYIRTFGEAAMVNLWKADPEGFDAAMKAELERLENGTIEFQSRWGTVVEDWASCPVCKGGFTSRVEHAVYCEPCGLYFSDANFMPMVDQSLANYGALQLAQGFLSPPEMLSSYGHHPGLAWTTTMGWRLQDAKGAVNKGSVVALVDGLMRPIHR
jgi:hypothetical protein